MIITLSIFSSGVAIAEPMWKRELVAFNKYEFGKGPWTEHKALRDKLHKDFPDDIQVAFSTLESPKQYEFMWVSIIDYDEESQSYLGILLNEPNFLKIVKQSDNVVFKLEGSPSAPVAISGEGKYWIPAVPKHTTSGKGFALYQGLREYRMGNFGHNMPEIEKCIGTLSSLTKDISELSNNEEKFLSYFILGRCAAENYQTMLAIDSFKSALTIKPNEVDANMALLAEYSIAVYDPETQPKSVWETNYLNHLAFLRSNFSEDERISPMLDILFDETELSKQEGLTETERDYRKKFGNGTFRWKAK